VKKIKPLGNWVVVRRISSEEEGGIILPGTAQEKRFTTEVVAIGEEVTRVKKGDSIVAIAQHIVKFTNTPDVDDSYFMIRDCDIIGILEEGEMK